MGLVAHFFTQLAVLLIYQVQSLPSFGDCMILTTYYQNQNDSMRWEVFVESVKVHWVKMRKNLAVSKKGR